MTSPEHARTLTPGQKVLYVVFMAAMRVLGLLPRPVLEAVARVLGRLWYRIDARHRNIALDNLEAAYPEKSRAWAETTAKRTFVHLATLSLELPGLLRVKRSSLDQYVRFTGLEHIREVLEKDEPFVMMTAHFGNWELLALALSLELNVSIRVVARTLDLAALDQVIRKLRTRTGNQIIDKENSAKTLALLLREKKPIGILLDQNAAPYEGVYVPFFGRTACTNKGLALLALRHKARVVPCFSFRESSGRYHIVAQPPISLERTGNIRNDVEANTALFNRVMEENIRKSPWQWLWVHRRWRMLDMPNEEIT